nr:type II toxin-antitoxin system PemK/MazF family toxin [uncultured Flavobacterium sp.]
MAYNRGEIIEMYLDLPYLETSKPHPFVIISNDDVYQEDGMYICVMLTHSTKIDKFTFEVTNEMLVKSGDGKFSQVRCHLVVNVKGEHIIKNSNRNSIKKTYVDRLVSRVEVTALSQ